MFRTEGRDGVGDKAGYKDDISVITKTLTSLISLLHSVKSVFNFFTTLILQIFLLFQYSMYLTYLFAFKTDMFKK